VEHQLAHRRQGLRLPGFDYSHGGFFVTIRTEGGRCLLGEAVHGGVRLSPAGEMVTVTWRALPERFPGMLLDELVVMPNHLHAILMLGTVAGPGRSPVGANLVFAPTPSRAQRGDHKDRGEGDHKDRGEGDHKDRGEGDHKDRGEGDHKDRPYGTAEGSLGRVVQAFKSLTTHEYIAAVKAHGWPIFAGRLWQRNYWEHVIRDAPDLNAIREYIANNPLRWVLDEENPARAEARGR
jgi:REP element-mobilizing transposase RayT